jgi:CheY-like chemotaxis protein
MNPTQSVILVIEDDAAIRRGIVDALERYQTSLVLKSLKR